MKRIVISFLLAIASALWGQGNPPPVAAFTYSAGSWAAAITTATGSPLAFEPPAAALYCFNSSTKKWVPADSSCFGGGGPTGPAGGVLSGSYPNPGLSASAQAIPNGWTATTQSANDNSTKVATTAYADTKLGLGGGTLTGPLYAPNIEAVVYADQYAGADACAKINTATTALPSTGGVVNAIALTGSQNCSTNPFANAISQSKAITLLLGATNYLTSASWVVPSQSVLRGLNTGGSTSQQSWILETTGFPSTTPIVDMGVNSGDQGVVVEYLTLDCNPDGGGGANGIGLRNQNAQEGSHARELHIIGCSQNGILFTGSGAQNSSISDVNITDFSAAVTGTIGLDIDGVSSMREIRNVTVNEISYTSKPAACVNFSSPGGVMENIHAEQCTIGIEVGATNNSIGATVLNVVGNSTVTTVVNLATGHTLTGFTAIGVWQNGATNTLINQNTGYTNQNVQIGTYTTDLSAAQTPCSVTLTNGGSAIPAATYTTPFNGSCRNRTGSAEQITSVQCYSDNSGTSSGNVKDNSGDSLLTGAITASPSWVAGTLNSSYPTLANNAWTNWTLVADGTSDIVKCTITFTSY